MNKSKIKNLCYECNEFINEYNESFNIDPFIFYHAKSKDCREDFIGHDGKKITCLMIYCETLRRFSYPVTISRSFFDKINNQPERLNPETSKDDVIV